MQRTKILAIAPYEGLREILLEQLSARDDVQADVYMGDLAAGAAIATTLEKEGYDVILSRGGTAMLIQETVDLPVIDITPSASDLLRYVRMAQNIPGRFAIVGFSSITHTAEELFGLMGIKIKTVTLREEQDAEATISALADEGYSLLVGDTIAVSTAMKLRMNTILIASGKESVKASLDEAVRLSALIHASVHRNLVYKDIIDKSGLSVIAFDAQKRLIYSNLTQDQLEYQRAFRPLPEYVSATLQEGEFHITRRIKNNLFEIKGYRSHQPAGDSAVFYINRRLSIPRLKDGVVEYYHMLDANQEEKDPWPIDNIGAMAAVMESARTFGKVRASIVLSGETGVPYDDVAFAIYQASPLSTSPFVVIDCSLIDAKSFDWVLENEKSPLFEAHVTIFMKHFSALDEEQCQRFIRHAECSSLSQRNRLIFCVSGQAGENELMKRYFSTLDCCLLRIPPLKDRPQDIAGLASLYLSALNIMHGRQVLGFEEAGNHLMTGYDWPGNNNQLNRFVKQCLLRVTSPYIPSGLVLEGIANERKMFASTASMGPPLYGTLEEINKHIALAVLREENMNRQRTAQRLGISRSTLWRMLSGMPEQNQVDP